MASKPRKPIDPAMSDDRARGSVFDRLGAKQTMSQPPYHHQIRSSSNKMQSSKYENSDYPPKSDARRKLDHPASYHTSSHSRHYAGSGNQYAPDSSYSQQPFRPQTSGSKPAIKSKINKEDLHHDQYKNKNYSDQGAEVLEQKRMPIKRELQSMDQKHEHPNRRRAYKSPCSSHDSCSSSGSSGSESGSDSYTDSSCSSSSCSSFSEDEVPHKKSQQLPRTKSYIVDKSAVAQQQHLKNSKRNQSQSYQPTTLNSSISNAYSKRLKAGSPQSTSSSYYSRKSARAGPLTPPLPSSSHHSLSNTPSSSTKLPGDSGGMKLDRHGNVRVSLQDKERQQQRRSAQPIHSPASFGSQHNLSMNYSTKSSRSPMSRSREDLYSSFGSEEKKKFTPSPIHHPPFHNQRGKQHGYYDEPYSSRSPNSPFFYNSNSKQSSASNLRQNMQPHRSPADNYLSPANHRNVSPYGPPRTPPLPSHHPPSVMMSKPNKYGIDYDDPLKSHPLDPLSVSGGWQPMKRNFNKFNSNNNIMQQQPPFNPHHAQMNYSPLRTKSSLSNTHPHYPDSQPPFKKQSSFTNFQQNKQQASKSILSNQSANKTQNLKTVNQVGQLATVKQALAAKPASAATANKLVDQVAVDEISSISNNSLEDMDALNEEQKIPKCESVQSKKADGSVAVKESGEKEVPEESKDGSTADQANGPAESVKQSYERPNEDAPGGQKKDEEQDGFSDENFSEWSDIDEYYSKTMNNQINVVEDSVSIPAAEAGDKPPTNSVAIKSSLDNDDDLKFKIDEELDEISDTEFDGIIDEQHLENEKSGVLSCKQVLDQLDIDWASLMGDSEGEDQKQSISTSTDALSRFKSAKLLSQIGISSKYSGDELSSLIRNYCSVQLNDQNFDFESPLAILHSSRKSKLAGDQPLTNSDLHTNGNSELDELEMRKLLSNGDLLGPKKILSFNHLVRQLRRKQEAITEKSATKATSEELESSKPPV